MTSIRQKISDYSSLVKISHTIFSLPFAFIGFFLAVETNGSAFPLQKLLLILLCVFFARNAAMGFNRWADREFDARNPRTARREIPGQIIRPRSAMFFVLGNTLLFMSATWFLNPLCFFLSPVALAVVLGYSLTKRFTPLSHLVLGLGLSLAPIGAYLAIIARFDWLPALFSLIVLFWVSGFDILYALQDIDFDRSMKLRSIPAALGLKKSLILSGFLHLITILMVALCGVVGPFGWIYWTGGLIFSGLLIYEHILVTPGDISRVNLAFATMNGMASVVYAIFVITDLLGVG
jgi:4-hydroxybenzoate polyprenyltransferase